MDPIAIRASGLGKRFRIGAPVVRYKTLRETLVRATRNRIARWRGQGGRAEDSRDLWALRDIEFEVPRGDVVGIVGRNGAGKSTLLKILSRITEPTTGYADVNGTIGSLLEVGTGFHPELTGRENVFLSAAILGMKKREITSRFDEIVSFAEVSRVIDTPVKYYSSGMYFRLAFAVAAHLDPEILVIDEVLAVGDSAFQAKCLGKMGDVARQGRTILFVSHNMSQMRRLCRTGFWIHEGRLVRTGPIAEVIGAYQQLQSRLVQSLAGSAPEAGVPAGFLSWRLLSGHNANGDGTLLTTEGPVSIQVTLSLQRRVVKADYDLILLSPGGQRIAGWRTRELTLDPGIHIFTHHFPGLPVRPGAYTWYTGLWEESTRIDETTLAPELIVTTQDHSGLRDDWPVVVNIPCQVSVGTNGAGLHLPS